MSFTTASLEHYNRTIPIPGAPKDYDFSVHGRGDFSKFIVHLRKILLRRREDVFSGRRVRALKSCDAYARSTKIVLFFCALAARFFEIYPSTSKNSFTRTRGCVYRSRGWSTKMLRYIFLEHLNLKIFLCIMRQI